MSRLDSSADEGASYLAEPQGLTQQRLARNTSGQCPIISYQAEGDLLLG